MTESTDLYAEVAALRAQVDDVGASTEALLRVSGTKLKSDFLEYLQDEVAREIFLLCDGKSSQAEITAQIIAMKVRGGSAMGVSRRIDRMLNDHGLLVKEGQKGNSPVYRHSHVSKALKIARSLR